MTTETFVKDIKPGLKNLNLIFIVLETGGSAGAAGPPRRLSGWGEPFLTCTQNGRAHPQDAAYVQPLPAPASESCSRV